MITLHYESRFGLARGAVYYQGQPHLYGEGYEHDPRLGLLGTRSVARVGAKAGGMVFLKLADGEAAVLEAGPEILAKLNEGAAVEIEIIAEARGDKQARGKFAAAAEGEPRRLSPVLSLKDRLLAQSLVFLGDQPVTFDNDPDALDTAATEARNPSGELPGGGYLSVEPTRALIACDVDSAGGGENRPSKAFAKSCNERAVSDLPRRLRLSGLAGLVVVDLIGSRHDADRLRALLKEGFGPEFERITVGPIGKFGTLEFTRPWGACPLVNVLQPVGQALYLLQQAVAVSAQDRGRVLTIRSRSAVIDVLRPLVANSLDPLAPMLRLEIAAKSEVITL